MSEPYDEPMFRCDSCGENYLRDDINSVDGQHICDYCVKELERDGE